MEEVFKLFLVTTIAKQELILTYTWMGIDWRSPTVKQKND